MASFGDKITFVGGVNKPKLVRCIDSAGRQHKQLVKSGNDDMRQVRARGGGVCRA